MVAAFSAFLATDAFGSAVCSIVMVCKWDQEPGTRDFGTLELGIRDPLKVKKVGSKTHLKGTPESHSNIESRVPGLPSKCKKGPM